MKRVVFFVLFSVLVSFGDAQILPRRGHIENTTDSTEDSSSYEESRLRRIGQASSAPLPCTGSPKVPVVLVQFKDKSFTVADSDEEVKSMYDEFLNKKEGKACTSLKSVYAYFKEQSFGKFTPEFDVIGPVTLDNNYSYYGKNSGNNKDVNISKFYSEACKKAVSSYDVSWSSFDNNADGKVDMVFFIYAGEGENNYSVDDANLIWPKEGTSTLSVTVDDYTIKFGAYGCTCELYNGAQDGVGTMCHELSHALGLPDFYDVNYVCYGMDYWDLMDSGCYQIDGLSPVGYSAYERDFMGWIDIVTLNPDSAYTLTLEPLETSGVAYRIVNKTSQNECFIFENRQNIGSDTYLGWPAANLYRKYGYVNGLMVTHVDYSANAWSNNTVNTAKDRQRMTLVPADGVLTMLSDYSASGTAAWAESMMGDLYPYSYTDNDGNEIKITALSSYATYTGSGLGVTVDNIRKSDKIITLDVNGGTVIPALADSIQQYVTLAENLLTQDIEQAKKTSLTEAMTTAQSLVTSKDQDAMSSALSNLKSIVDELTEALSVGDVSAENRVERIYGLDGTVRTSDKSGVVIVRYSDGRVVKISK